MTLQLQTYQWPIKILKNNQSPETAKLSISNRGQHNIEQTIIIKINMQFPVAVIVWNLRDVVNVQLSISCNYDMLLSRNVKNYVISIGKLKKYKNGWTHKKIILWFLFAKWYNTINTWLWPTKTITEFRLGHSSPICFTDH